MGFLWYVYGIFMGFLYIFMGLLCVFIFLYFHWIFMVFLYGIFMVRLWDFYGNFIGFFCDFYCFFWGILMGLRWFHGIFSELLGTRWHMWLPSWDLLRHLVMFTHTLSRWRSWWPRILSKYHRCLHILGEGCVINDPTAILMMFC